MPATHCSPPTSITARHLYARTVGTDDTLGAQTDIGEVAGTGIAVCRTGRGLIVAVLDRKRGATALAFQREGTWSKPVRASSNRPRPSLGPSWMTSDAKPGRDAHASTRCAPGELSTTWLDHDTIHQMRCTPKSCATTSAPLHLQSSATAMDNHAYSRAIALADFGQRVVLARLVSTPGAVTTGRKTTLRIRAAPLAGLAAARDTLVLASGRDGMPGSLGTPGVMGGLEMFVRRDAAILLLSAGDTRYAMRVDASGHVTPVSVMNAPGAPRAWRAFSSDRCRCGSGPARPVRHSTPPSSVSVSRPARFEPADQGRQAPRSGYWAEQIRP